jgi:hypothetical protein
LQFNVTGEITENGAISVGLRGPEASNLDCLVIKDRRGNAVSIRASVLVTGVHMIANERGMSITDYLNVFEKEDEGPKTP